MSIREEIKNAQKRWAASKSIEFDEKGYVSKVEDNLQSRLSGRIRNAFINASGSELRETGRGPAHMKALHSSSALAVNCFSYWADKDRWPLLSALEVDWSTVESLDFEVQFRTGLRGSPPHLDVVLWSESNRTIAIESKFTEWLSRKGVGENFEEKYLSGARGLWTQHELHQCQEVADEIGAGKYTFEYLDVEQLLKHTLGLATQLGKGKFSLYYLYHDWPCDESKYHSKEMKCFGNRIEGELEFLTLTYQDLYGRLPLPNAPESEYGEYMDYMCERYLSREGAARP